MASKPAFNGPLPTELLRAYALMDGGKSDAAIAATLSAERPHGQFRVDPQSIAQLRKGR